MRWPIRDALLALLLGIATALSGPACSSSEERAEQARRRLAAALTNGQHREALAALESFEAARPDTPDARTELASYLVQAGEAPRALWVLEAGVERFPDRDDVALAAANVALMVGDPARARKHLERIGRDSEHHARALLTQARAELALGHLERALELFDEVEERHPDLPDTRILRIRTLLEERRLDEARARLAQARSIAAPADRDTLRLGELALYEVELARGEVDVPLAGLGALIDADPDDPLAWQSFVRAHIRNGTARSALARLETALQEDPGRLALYGLAAVAHVALGEIEPAERRLLAFVERTDSPTGHVRLAQFQAMHGNEQRSVQRFREAAERFPHDAEVHFAYAEALLGWGHVEEARERLIAFRSTTRPDDPRIDYLRGRIQLAEGDPEAARVRLLEVAPRFDTAVVQHWLGAALEALGDRVGADRRYRAALRRDATLVDTHRALLRLAEQRGDWRAVAGLAQGMVRVLPLHLEAWSALVDALVRLGRPQEAEQAARRAVELFPDRVQPTVLLARALGEAGRDAEALARIEEARERFERTPALEAQWALVLGMAGRTGEGIRAAQQAAAHSPESAQLQLALAILLFGEGRAEDGSRAVDRALDLDPTDPWPLRVRARFRAASGALEGARHDAERYLELRPDDAGVHFLLGVVHERSGRFRPAIASYRRAAQLDPEGFIARNNLAELLAANGDLDAALAAGQEAYRLAEDDPHVLDTLGGLYLRKGLFERAVFLLEEAHAARPDWAQTQLRLALAYRGAGRSGEARRLLADLARREGVPAELRARADEALQSAP